MGVQALEACATRFSPPPANKKKKAKHKLQIAHGCETFSLLRPLGFAKPYSSADVRSQVRRKRRAILKVCIICLDCTPSQC